jgi:hypothetical protein
MCDYSLRHGSFILAGFDRARDNGPTEWRELAHARQRIARTYPRSVVQSAPQGLIDLVNLDQEVGGPPLPHGANQVTSGTIYSSLRSLLPP